MQTFYEQNDGFDEATSARASEAGLVGLDAKIPGGKYDSNGEA